MMEKLPEEFKQKWVAALRSGEHKQCKSSLYDRSLDGYCCLGVAGLVCDVPKETMDGKAYFCIDSDTDTRLRPMNGYPEILATDLNSDVRSRLSTMNDYGGKSFSEIAQYIEDNL